MITKPVEMQRTTAVQCCWNWTAMAVLYWSVSLILLGQSSRSSTATLRGTGLKLTVERCTSQSRTEQQRISSPSRISHSRTTTFWMHRVERFHWTHSISRTTTLSFWKTAISQPTKAVQVEPSVWLYTIATFCPLSLPTASYSDGVSSSTTQPPTRAQL